MSPDNDFNTAAADMQKPKPGALTSAMNVGHKPAEFWAELREDRTKVEKSFLTIVESLLARGADVNGSDRGVAPLMRAALLNFTTIAALLINEGARLDERDNDGEGYTALSHAVCRDHIEMVRLLIAAGAEDLELKSHAGLTLPVGSSENHEEARQIVLDEAAARQHAREESARAAAEAKENARCLSRDWKLDQLRGRARQLTIRPSPARGGLYVAR